MRAIKVFQLHNIARAISGMGPNRIEYRLNYCMIEESWDNNVTYFKSESVKRRVVIKMIGNSRKIKNALTKSFFQLEFVVIGTVGCRLHVSRYITYK